MKLFYSIIVVVVFVCSCIMNRKRIPLSRADIIIQNAAIKLRTHPVVGKRVAPCSNSPEKENQNYGHCRRSTRRRRVSRQLLFDSVIMDTFGLFICLHRGRGGGKEKWGSNSAGARAYNGGLGTEPPAGIQGRSPRRGSRGRSPLKPTRF